MGIEVCIHIANILFLISYLVRDIFLLRILSLVAGFSLLPYYFLVQGGPIKSSIFWSIVFSSVNIYQLIKLYRERKPVQLTRQEHLLYQSSFSSFTMRQFRTLLDAATQNNMNCTDADTELSLSYDFRNQIMFVLEGCLEANKKAYSEGQLIGTVDYVTQSACTNSIRLEENCALLVWKREQLDKLFEKDKELYASWQSLLSKSLAEQLNEQSV